MNAILFDLGNTLVRYFSRQEMPAIRKRCVESAARFLEENSFIEPETAERAEELFDRENYEDKIWRVRPLEERLIRCFDLPPEFVADPAALDLCAAFARPFFEISERYSDTVPVLEELRQMKIKLAIVTNLAWGSPAPLWREELARHGLVSLVDVIVTCRDVGWRKPAPVIFECTATQLGVTPGECMFVGDDPRWDYAGAEGAGMKPLLIVRDGPPDPERDCVHDLKAVLERAKASR